MLEGHQLLGLGLIGGVVVIWVLSSELIQFIFDDVGVSQPLFLTFYSTSLFSVYLLGFVFCPSWRLGAKDLEALAAAKDAGGWTPARADSGDDSMHGSLISEVSALEEGRVDGARVAQAMDGEEYSLTPTAAKRPMPHTHRAVKNLTASDARVVQAMDGEEYSLTPKAAKRPMPHMHRADKILTASEVARKALFFAPAWIAANWSFNASLCLICGSGTSVASNTVISSTSTVFTLILSAVLLGERINYVKTFCVLLSVSGVILVTSADAVPGKRHEPSHVSSLKGAVSPLKGGTLSIGAYANRTAVEIAALGMVGDDGVGGNATAPSDPVVPLEPHTLGDVLSLVSALLFACYSVLIKWLIPCERTVRMPMFFGFLGVFSAAMCIPILLCLDVTGVEVMHVIPEKVLMYLTVNGMIGTVLSDLLWAKAIVLTSPLTVNLGMSLTIPLSCLADYLNPSSPSPRMAWEYVVGALMVFSSFVFVNAADMCFPDVDDSGSGNSASASASQSDANLTINTSDEDVEKTSLLLPADLGDDFMGEVTPNSGRSGGGAARQRGEGSPGAYPRAGIS